MTIDLPATSESQARKSLSTTAAAQLAHTTKSEPQMQGITSWWLTRMLPWVEVKGGVYRVNRRLTHTVGNGDLVNNPDFGLLNNCDLKQRIYTEAGPPTPDDMDELLSMRRHTKLFLAHPKAIAAFGRECNKRGLYPEPIDVDGHRIPAWRGVPIYPCGKIPVSNTQTTSILAMRIGEKDQGVVGLHQTGLPDEYEPGLNIRFKGIDDRSIISYLVSCYYSAAVLVPDALGVLDNVLVARQTD
ncbi:hypothetical protein [Nocardia sp. NPDC051570]|uniref:hypothetical protein n=1 Tax=Nocardia sp. NPDC051570 TaxID=3364324 RepID=UPI0037BD0F8D